MAVLILALAVAFAVVGCRFVLAMNALYKSNNAVPEGYVIDTEEHWHDFFQRPYWTFRITNPEGVHIDSGGGSMTTSHGEAMRNARDLLRIHLKRVERARQREI